MNESFSFDAYFHPDLSFLNFEELDTFDTIDDPKSQELYHSEVIHDGKKSHLCTFPGCGKIFKFKSEITRHLVIHFVERPFVCPVEDCRKAFKRADALENHSLLHSQELTFRCHHPNCELRFLTRSSLKYHMLKHQVKKLFVCGFEGCGRSFLTKAQLKQHEKAENFHKKMAVTGNKPTLDESKPLKKAKTSKDNSNYSLDHTMEAVPRVAESLIWDIDDSDQTGEFINISPEFIQTAPQSNYTTTSAQRTTSFEEFQNPVQSNSSQVGYVEDVFQKVLEENKLLKQKLDIYSKMMEIFHENDKLKNQFPNVTRTEENLQCGMHYMMPGQMGNLVGSGPLNFMKMC